MLLNKNKFIEKYIIINLAIEIMKNGFGDIYLM